MELADRQQFFDIPVYRTAHERKIRADDWPAATGERRPRTSERVVVADERSDPPHQLKPPADGQCFPDDERLVPANEQT